MKVFLIGFNKTGTTSVHSLFTELGLSSYHGMYSDWKLDDPRFDQFECFSDGEKHDFVGLDQKFPGSKFVLTSRRLDDWLVSRVRHVDIRRAVDKTGWMRKQYDANPHLAIKQWIQYRNPYHDAVYKHFVDRPDALLSLNICDSKNHHAEAAKLLSFLDMHTDAPVAFPHERKTETIAGKLNSGIKRFLLKKYKPQDDHKIRTMIEEALTELGIPRSQWGDDGLR